MKKITVLMAAVLAVVTVLAAGLTVLPGSIQEAQANPCATEFEVESEGDVGTITITDATSTIGGPDSDSRTCDFTGPVELDED